MRRILLALSLLFVTTTAGMCDDDPASPNSVVGTYTLVSIGGDPLPSTFQDGQNSVTITAGSVVLAANNTFTFSETHSGSSTPEVIIGNWSLSGSTITFTPTNQEENNSETATISGNTLTLTLSDFGGVWVFTKQ